MEDVEQQSAPPVPPASVAVPVAKKPLSVEDLLERNLKWSQIIYEQNRRLNRKVFLMSLLAWVRTIFIVAMSFLALIYLPPLLGKISRSVEGVLNAKKINQTEVSSESLSQIIKLLSLDPAQEAEVRALLK